jgi:hypothetical protein
MNTGDDNPKETDPQTGATRPPAVQGETEPQAANDEALRLEELLDSNRPDMVALRSMLNIC